MWSAHATRRPVNYTGLHARQPRRAVVLHTNGGGTDHGSLFGLWSDNASGANGDGNRHIGAHFQVMRDGQAEQYCLTPENRVLTADLRWVPLGDLMVGDELVGFDEHGPDRRYRRAVVEAITFAREPVWGVVLEDERVIYATGEHRWLVRGPRGVHWRQTRVMYDTRPQSIQGGNVPQLFTPWSTPTDYDAGWLAGMFDGEGTLNKHGLSFAQNAGPVLDRALDLLKHRGSDVTVRPNGKCQTVHVTGGLRDRLAFLGSVRPERLIRKADPDNFGRIYSGDKPPTLRIIAVYPAGDREIAKVATSTGTYIAEGFPMHNCDTSQVIYHAYSASEFAVGIETEDDGHPDTPWNAYQLGAIIALCHELKVPGRLLMDSPSDGIGWHEQYRDWNQSGHTCPGKVREQQIHDVILPALRQPTPPPHPSPIPGWYHRVLRVQKPYMTGGDVGTVQAKLRVTPHDGIYGPRTAAAVDAFQHAHHLATDGVVGPDTARALGN